MGRLLWRQREEVWSALHSAVRGTPWRAQLIIAGDFNRPCLPEPSLAGPGIPQVEHIRQTDQPRFQQLISTFDLNVHNTWQRKKHAHTYRFPKKDGLQQAQIDFVMIRACQADAAARCARPLRTPFVPATGMHHLPILVSLPRPTRPRTPTTCRSVTAADVNIMLRDHPHLSLQFQDCVQQLLTPHTVPAGTPSIEPVRDPNSVLLSAWTSVTKGLPTPPKPTGVATHSPGMVRQLWKLRHLRSHLPATCSIMRRWLITAKLAKLQRQLHRICRDKKRERIDGILQEAAASPHLSAIYSAIRRLAPKSRHQCIQLRDKQGNLLSPQQETEAIAEYFRGVYGSTGQLSPPLSRPLFGVQFELDDLQRGLRNLCRLVLLLPGSGRIQQLSLRRSCCRL